VMQVKYQLAQATGVQLVVYDAAGRRVRSLIDARQEPGYYTVRWDACDDAGRRVAAGVYFVRFETTTYEKVEKAVLLR
jgi:flagellar hook assembly protein FlgD